MANHSTARTRRLRAPREHGESLIDPPPAAVPKLLAANRLRLTDDRADALGWSLAEWIRPAREHLVREAWQYTSQYRDPGPLPVVTVDRPLLAAGHQPQLFHAGVWFKNFLLNALANRHQAVAVNLIIDNDAFRSPAIRVPTRSERGLRTESVPFDGAADVVPIEERTIRDPALFHSFPHRVRQTLHGLIDAPLAHPLWAQLARSRSPGGNLGWTLAQARNRLEADWGVNNLELPLSAVCRGSIFRRFLLEMLRDAVRFGAIYNECLADYRRVYRIRSRSHPVPALARQDDWQEAPFWVWQQRDPRRRGLFVRSRPAGLELSDRHGWRASLAASPTGDTSAWLEQVAAWERQGVKLRPRALTTTMFTRLLLCDLFVHGIGGAKYDELTDAIIGRYFQRTPPEYLVATATLHLPLPGARVDVGGRLRDLHQQLRELRYHPERYLRDVPELQPIIASKRRWLGADPPRGQRRARHEAIERCNAALLPHLKELRHQCLAERGRLLESLPEQRVLASREFSFCLFPESTLRGFLLALASQEP